MDKLDDKPRASGERLNLSDVILIFLTMLFWLTLTGWVALSVLAAIFEFGANHK